MNSVNVSSSKVPMAQQKQDVDNVVMGQIKTGKYKRIYNSSIYNDKDLIDASIIPSSEMTISNIV